jgi:hypothetical protein
VTRYKLGRVEEQEERKSSNPRSTREKKDESVGEHRLMR